MTQKLKSKVAMITGGNSGIGLAVAKLFAAQGAKVIITGRNQKTLDEAIISIGHNALGFVSDVSQISSFEVLYKKVHAICGNIDVLVVFNEAIKSKMPANRLINKATASWSIPICSLV